MRGIWYNNEADEQSDSSDSSEYDPSEHSCASSDNNAIRDSLKCTRRKLEEYGVYNKNASEINREMQILLFNLRDLLELSLSELSLQSERNEKDIIELARAKGKPGIGIRGAYLRGGTFYFKGNMFFKDMNCRSCPNHPDYINRSTEEHEMFPMDLELRGKHMWSVTDRKALVLGVKEQAVDCLIDEKKRRNRRSATDIVGYDLSVQKNIELHSGKLRKLLANVNKNFCIDWEQISCYDLKYRHTPVSCKAMWNMYLQPSVKRGPWTPKENTILQREVKSHNFQNWAAIANHLKRRSEYQCYVQYRTKVVFLQRQRWVRWNRDDNTRLQELIQKNTVDNVINWNSVASYFPGRPKSALQQHYASSLHPQISHAPFTGQEDLLLISAVKEYGGKFACFPRTLFPNRSLTQLRARYTGTLLQRDSMAPWSLKDDKKLLDFVAKHGTSSWMKCSKLLGNHSRCSCRTRYLTIQKFFKKNPKAKVEDVPRRPLRLLGSIISSKNYEEKFAEYCKNPNTDLKPPKRRKVHSKKKTEPKPVKKTKKQLKAELREQRKLEREARKKSTKRKVVARNQPRSYSQRLRNVGRVLYDFFKYAYNFRLGEDPCIPSPFLNSYSLQLMTNTLDFRVPIDQPYKYDTTIPKPMRKKIETVLTRATQNRLTKSPDYCLPPSWCTAMAFRALCVQVAKPDIGIMTVENQLTIESSGAAKLFRQRFSALFYKTALLSRLDPKKITDKFLSVTSKPGCVSVRPIESLCDPNDFSPETTEMNQINADFEIKLENLDSDDDQSVDNRSETILTLPQLAYDANLTSPQ